MFILRLINVFTFTYVRVRSYGALIYLLQTKQENKRQLLYVLVRPTYRTIAILSGLLAKTCYRSV